MNMPSLARPKKPILVTGSHRSGTTWVGRMLAAAPGVGFIGEPFSPLTRPGICSATFPYWYTYVTEVSDSVFRPAVEKTLHFRYDHAGMIRSKPGLRRLVRSLQDEAHFASCRVRGCRPLMKDPIAFFSAEWLASSFGMSVVVLVRHPAAFAASLKVKGWTLPFGHLAAQRELLSDRLSGFAGEIERFAVQETDLISQAILFWRLVHDTIHRYQESHPDWIVVRHEDLARNPSDRFRQLYASLGLSFTPRSARKIEASSHGPVVGSREGVIGIVRDSRASISTWKTRLTPDEIVRIRRGVEDVSSRFYEDDEW